VECTADAENELAVRLKQQVSAETAWRGEYRSACDELAQASAAFNQKRGQVDTLRQSLQVLQQQVQQEMQRQRSLEYHANETRAMRSRIEDFLRTSRYVKDSADSAGAGTDQDSTPGLPQVDPVESAQAWAFLPDAEARAACARRDYFQVLDELEGLERKLSAAQVDLKRSKQDLAQVQRQEASSSALYRDKMRQSRSLSTLLDVLNAVLAEPNGQPMDISEEDGSQELADARTSSSMEQRDHPSSGLQRPADTREVCLSLMLASASACGRLDRHRLVTGPSDCWPRAPGDDGTWSHSCCTISICSLGASPAITQAP